jgi:hypothetical protein
MTERTLNGKPIPVGIAEPTAPTRAQPVPPTWTHVAIVGEVLLFAWGLAWLFWGK